MNTEKKHYRGLVFDLDGTLIDTLQDLADSVNEALAKHGFPGHEADAYRTKVGKGFRNLIVNALPEENKGDDALVDLVQADFVENYSRLYLHKSGPYPGIREVLRTFAAEGIQMAVNSNKRNDYTTKLIETIFPEIPFVGVFGDRAGVPRKPDPASALELSGKMGLSPAEVLYVGDSDTDMQTGKNAGMDTIGCAWGFRGRRELSDHGATYIAESAEDILKIVRG